jgi:hypothetical protein
VTTARLNAAKYLVVMITALALNACGSPYYTSDPIEAWAVDADTGQPIEGAVVTANWQLVGFTLDTGGSKRGQLTVMETTTDANGRFFFPGFTKLNLSLSELRDQDPQILIFKPGYQYIGGGNDTLMGASSHGPHRKSQLGGQRLQIRKADPNPRKQADDLTGLTTALSNIADSGDADRVPQMLNAVACERWRLKALDPRVLVLVPGGSTERGRECAK